MDLVSNIHSDLQKGALQLVAEHREVLWAEAKRLGCNDADAEDLVLRTLDRALRKIDGFSGTGSVSGWMKSILHNLRLDDRRRPVNRLTTPMDPQTLETESPPDSFTEEQILKNSDSEALRAAIERLDPAYKQAVVMHYFAELPVKNIALALNLPLGTVLWRLSVARKMLAKDLSSKLGKKTAIVLAVLLGLGTLWAAWQAGLGTWLGPDDEAKLRAEEAMVPAETPAGAAEEDRPSACPSETEGKIEFQKTQKESEMNTMVKAGAFSMAAAALAAGTAFGDTAKSAALGYVTDGLVAHWDAIDNVATGTHDGAATTWVDLVSGITVTITNGSVGANYVQFNTTHRVKSDVTKFSGSDAVTIDVMARASTLPSDWKTAVGKAIFGLDRRSVLAYDLRQSGYKSGISLTYPITPGSQAGKLDYDYLVTGDSPENAVIADHHYAVASSLNDRTAYYDGAEASTFRMNYTQDCAEAPDGTCAFGGVFFCPRLYSVRVYNRKLTADEVAWNRVIDRGRYLGETAVDKLSGAALAVAEIPVQKWTGVTVPKPSVTVFNRFLGTTLVEGTDYEVGAASQVGASLGQVTVTGLGVYAGCMRVCQFPLVSAFCATVKQRGDDFYADVVFPAAVEVRELFVAGADADAGGERTNGWTTVVKFADVPAGVAELKDASLPAAVADCPMLRFFIEKKVSSADYIQQDLALQYDGIDNDIVNGVRTHNAEATVWKELTGASGAETWDLPIQDCWTVRAKSVYSDVIKDQDTPSKKGHYPSVTVTDADHPLYEPSVLTTEYVARRDAWYYRDSEGNHQAVLSTRLGYMSYRGFGSGSFGLARNELVSGVLKLTHDTYGNTGVQVTDVHTMTARLQNKANDFLIDARPLLNPGVGGVTADVSTAHAYNFLNNSRAPVEVYAIRVYTRKLTDAEVAYNARVDAARFGTGKFFVGSDPVVGIGVTSAVFAGRRTTVTAPVAGYDRHVIAVWGEADGGAEAGGWAQAAELGVLASGETSATFTLSKPFCSATVKRLLVSSATNSYSYVTDGLILQYDGVDNTIRDGVRLHDAQATFWSDLSGNGCDVAFPGWVQVESRGVLSQGTTAKQIPKLTWPLVGDADKLTVEYVMNHRGWSESGSRVASAQTVFTTPLGFAYYRQKDSSTDIELWAFRLRYDSGTPLDLGYWTMSDKAFSSLHTFSVAFNKLLGDAGRPSLLLDGATQCSWTDGNYPVAASVTCNYFNNQAANIGVAAIRVYNRQLTADEAAANAAIDRARFFGDKASAAYESTPAFGEIPPAGLMLIVR